MNIHELYKKEKVEKDKVKYTNGGRGEFFGGNQIYTGEFNKKIVPFTGKGHKLNKPTRKLSYYELIISYLKILYNYLLYQIKKCLRSWLNF